MKERLAKLIDVKSIVTLVLTGVFAYLAIAKTAIPGDYMTIFSVIIAFYFGTQATKTTNK
ncbi:MAG: hypothetical protein GX488_00715 [Clostridiales bacterium]|nr:hypothetical protein [Clostridiales bacterium]